MAIAPGDGLTQKQANAATNAAQKAAAARAAKVAAAEAKAQAEAEAAAKAAAAKSSSIPYGSPVAGFKPTITFNPAPADQQIGPMIGPNLGKDAAAIIAAGGTLSPEQRVAGEAFNVAKGLNPDGTPVVVKKEVDKNTRDAYALLEEAFKLYDLESLVPVIRGYMENDLGVEQAKLKLKTEQAYKDRFKGNELRRAQGLNVLGEDAYLALENDYSETLKSYGLSDYFGVATNAATRTARQQKMADVIGGDISATEFKERIKTVVTRVNMADANTKTALKSLYDITDTDLVKYFLNPTEGSETLKRKVTVAEISAASMTAGLGQTSLAAAEELARLGIDKAKALTGYENIAGYLPGAEKLSAIYKDEGINYDKATGEEEEFKGLASAKRKRQRLSERETSAFSGSSGTSSVSLKSRTAGQI